MRLLGPLLLVLSTAACAAPLAYRADAGSPVVRRFDAGGLAVDVAVTVRSGEASARILGVDWEVLAGGLPIGVGTTAVEEVVPAGGETVLALPLVLEAGADLPEGIRPAIARGGSVPVLVRGAVRVRDRNGDLLALPFTAEARARVAPGADPARVLDESEPGLP